MKTDVWTKIIIVFIVGVLASSAGFTDVFRADDTRDSAPALQQGVTFR